MLDGGRAEAKGRIAVLLPCHNEAATIAATVAGFRRAIPNAEIWVCDNCSTDETARIARDNQARVITEPLKGKGNAVRRLFAEVDADIYVLSDGDTTYDSSAAPALIEALVSNHLDMVIGQRVSAGQNAYRKGHRFGNYFFSNAASFLFGFTIQDLFSGFRVFSRRFVKTFPATSEGFEIESELNVHAIDQRLPTMEIPVNYYARPTGSFSKLSTYRDGFRILMTLLRLLRDVRPMQFFGSIAACVILIALLLSIPIFINFISTGFIPNIPTAILVTGLSLLAFLLFIAGVILDAIRLARHNDFRAAYLAQDTSYFQTVAVAKVGEPTSVSLIRAEA